MYRGTKYGHNMLVKELTTMLMNPVFPQSCQYDSYEESNFLDGYVDALQALVIHYEKFENPLTANNIALVQTNGEEYIFLVDTEQERFEIVQVSPINEDMIVTNSVSVRRLSVEPKE